MLYRSLIFFSILLLSLPLLGQQYSVRTAHLYVQSANKFANIEADNYQVNSTIDATTGKVNILGLLKSFEFRIGGLDRAFNSRLAKTVIHPKFKYIGEISNIESVNFNRPGTYSVNFKGTLIIWDMERTTPGSGTIEVHADGFISFTSDISFQIEEASVEKANKLIQSYLPSGININTDQLGLSRNIKVQASGKYRKRRSSSTEAN